MTNFNDCKDKSHGNVITLLAAIYLSNYSDRIFSSIAIHTYILCLAKDC